MDTAIPTIQLTLDLNEHVRYGAPAIKQTTEGGLEVNGELVLNQIAFSCGLVVLATASGIVVLRQEAFDHWSDLVAQGLARDLQA
jgi:hypothetical protein